MEWVALMLIVAVALSAVAAASRGVGASWLPGRLACGLLGRACSSDRARADWRTASGRLRVPLRTPAGAPAGVLAAVRAPVAAVAPVASFISRHGKTIRKVAIATAIGTGVGAACAGAVIAANAIGAVACGSSIVTGGYAAYRNATD
ncbi:MAG: hypothetical protein QOD76_976 [Solirubrobacteraceae bacterium]|nr:hypothetical protein [Solirubrobacteraceae bacterium]